MEATEHSTPPIVVPVFETRRQRQNWLKTQSPETRAALTRQGKQRAGAARWGKLQTQLVAAQPPVRSVVQEPVEENPETVSSDPVEQAIKEQETLLQESDRLRRISANAAVGHDLAQTAIEAELSEAVILETIKKRYPELSGWRQFQQYTRRQKALRRTVMMEERISYLIAHSPIALFARFFSELQKLTIHEQESLRGIPQDELNRRLIELRTVIEKPKGVDSKLHSTLELVDGDKSMHSVHDQPTVTVVSRVEIVEPEPSVEVAATKNSRADLEIVEPKNDSKPDSDPVRSPAVWSPLSTEKVLLTTPDHADELKRLRQREAYKRG